jgi:hypothetical protein
MSEQIEIKTIEEIRKNGINKETLEKIKAEHAEMQRAAQEARDKLPTFISLKKDKEMKNLLFTGNYVKVEVPMRDFVSKEIIPGKMVTKYNMYAYDVTDPDHPSGLCIWQRSKKEIEQVMFWLLKNQYELTVMRNGAPNSQSTFYSIFPVSR